MKNMTFINAKYVSAHLISGGTKYHKFAESITKYEYNHIFKY